MISEFVESQLDEKEIKHLLKPAYKSAKENPKAVVNVKTKNGKTIPILKKTAQALGILGGAALAGYGLYKSKEAYQKAQQAKAKQKASSKLANIAKGTAAVTGGALAGYGFKKLGDMTRKRSQAWKAFEIEKAKQDKKLPKKLGAEDAAQVRPMEYENQFESQIYEEGIPKKIVVGLAGYGLYELGKKYGPDVLRKIVTFAKEKGISIEDAAKKLGAKIAAFSEPGVNYVKILFNKVILYAQKNNISVKEAVKVVIAADREADRTRTEAERKEAEMARIEVEKEIKRKEGTNAATNISNWEGPETQLASERCKNESIHHIVKRLLKENSIIESKKNLRYGYY